MNKSSKFPNNLIICFALSVIFISVAYNNQIDLNEISGKDYLKSQKIILVENDRDNAQENQFGASEGTKNNNNDRKPTNNDYEPQCDTPVWAMCTRRKKKHDDD
jgi:hypothetical protein